MTRFGACISVFALLIFASPLSVAAQSSDLPAGFAPNSIWLSSTHITAGDTINIFTVVYDSSGESLAGDVNFMIDGASVGVDDFTIKAGDTQIESIPWTAAQGDHSVNAQVENVSDADTKTGESVLNEKTDTITFVVAQAPPPTATQQAVNSVTSVVNASAPTVDTIAQQVYAATEQARQSAVNTLQQQLAPAAPSLEGAGTVLGTSTYRAALPSPQSTSILSTIWRDFLEALLFVCTLPILFYLMILFIIFIIFQIVRTWLRERRYRSR